MCKKNRLLFIILFLLLVLSTGFIGGCTSYTKNSNIKEYKYDDVKDILIRFHVIANSDNDSDQNVKNIIKDRIIEYMYPYLCKSDSIEESRKLLNENWQDILKIAKEVLAQNGFSYSVNIDFSRENFPEKNYGNIVLPAGEYEAFRVILGSGKGHNWWCVMFPPMCFIDVTKGRVEEEKSKEELDEEIEKNNQSNEEKQEYENIHDNNDEIKVKFKILELLGK